MAKILRSYVQMTCKLGGRKGLISIKTPKHKKTLQVLSCKVLCSGREGIQTPSLLIRSQTLYSIELRNHFAFKSAAKISKILYQKPIIRIFL